MSTPDKEIQKALAHIHYLSESIGGRGSCTTEERQAGEYVARQLRALSMKDVRSQDFEAVPSTYWGFALSFAAALTGSVLVVLVGGKGVLALASILSAAGVWGMLAETEFATSWVRWTLPRKPSQNVSGTIPPAGEVRRRVVLCAHVDSHRTPVFYSSNQWYMAFGFLVGLAFLSMAAGAALFGLGAAFGWVWVRWIAIGLAAVQLFGIVLCLHADFTPYSPGANDNASGVAVALMIAARLRQNPLAHTEVHFAFTGCEEVGDYGIAAYLDANAAHLGQDAFYVVLDEVGLGQLKYLSSDGLLLKHRTHPRALEIAREAVRRLPDLKAIEGAGLAYTDALQATKRGLIALTVCTVPAPKSGVESHWHRMTDRVETLNPDDLAATLQFTWTLLQVVDEA
jgi:hypothetical protein